MTKKQVRLNRATMELQTNMLTSNLIDRYRLVAKHFNLLRCDRNNIHHNTFNRKCDGVDELTVLTNAEHRREHCGSKIRNKS